MLVNATIPLLLEHGTAVTSRQIAAAAGVAEGTIFRAFGDKEALISAAVDAYLDPEPLRAALRAIDPSLPLEDKIATLLRLLRERFSGVFRMMAVIGASGPPPRRDARGEYVEIIAKLVAPEAGRLNVPPERVGPLLRLVAFASSIPQFNAPSPVDVDELLRFSLYGLAGARPTEGKR